MILACQKLLGQITKVLGFGETLPPRMGKTPKKSRIFFLTGSLNLFAFRFLFVNIQRKENIAGQSARMVISLHPHINRNTAEITVLSLPSES